jgi:hypothetical protein
MPSEFETPSAAPSPPPSHTSNPWKTQLISTLVDERREAAEDGGIRNRNPLDESEPFQRLCDFPLVAFLAFAVVLSGPVFFCCLQMRCVQKRRRQSGAEPDLVRES